MQLDIPKSQIVLFRRFARALAGDRETGDAVINAMLSAPFHMPSNPVHAGDVPLRAEIARRLVNIWATKHDQSADAPIQSPPHRTAFLLHTLEGFSIEQVAGSLDESYETTQAYINQAVDELEGQMSAKVLIIEDQPLIARDLEKLVEALNHSVIGKARTQDVAVNMAANLSPHLILSDVQLADGSNGIDAVKEIMKNTSVPVIFITSFPEEVLQGKPDEPTFVIAKPYSPPQLKAIISQALLFSTMSS